MVVIIPDCPVPGWREGRSVLTVRRRTVFGEVVMGAKQDKAGQTETPKRRGGFAAMDKERLREIARSGGRAVHASGKGHRFTSEEARRAGQKGGNAPHVSRGRPRPSTSSNERPA